MSICCLWLFLFNDSSKETTNFDELLILVNNCDLKYGAISKTNVYAIFDFRNSIFLAISLSGNISFKRLTSFPAAFMDL